MIKGIAWTGLIRHWAGDGEPVYQWLWGGNDMADFEGIESSPRKTNYQASDQGFNLAHGTVRRGQPHVVYMPVLDLALPCRKILFQIPPVLSLVEADD